MERSTYNCKCCGTECKCSSKKKNVYCSNKCQVEYQRKQLVEDWLAGGKKSNWKYSIPAWAKDYIKKVKKNKCSICKITTHNKLPLQLQVDHIDGNPYNNELDNLRLLCPNCHSQQPTWGNRNIGNGRQNRRKALYS